MKFIAKIITSALAIMLVTYILPGVSVNSVMTALVLALVLAFLNAIIKPILVLLTLPVTIVTFGLFLMVINALIILFAAKIVDGFQVSSFWWALLFSLILSIVNSILESLAGPSDQRN